MVLPVIIEYLLRQYPNDEKTKTYLGIPLLLR